jgi:hypothetical protein
LVVRAVRGIRVNDQLGIRQVLLQDERVHRVDDDVIAAVHHQCRLLDGFQIFVRTFTRCRPFGDGRALCRRDLVVDFRIAIRAAQVEAFEKLAARGLTGGRRRKENTEPQVIRRVVGRAEDAVAFRRTA